MSGAEMTGAACCVAGTKVPALIERSDICGQKQASDLVLPELKFRPSLSGFDPILCRDGLPRVLPELKFRPSLSAMMTSKAGVAQPGVAGTKVPALIERGSPAGVIRSGSTVLPELKFRPSLSVDTGGRGPPVRTVLPELKFRPSLSAATALDRHRYGLVLPELKFRPSLSVTVRLDRRGDRRGVLPELKFRPSLSVYSLSNPSAFRTRCCRN